MKPCNTHRKTHSHLQRASYIVPKLTIHCLMVVCYRSVCHMCLWFHVSYSKSFCEPVQITLLPLQMHTQHFVSDFFMPHSVCSHQPTVSKVPNIWSNLSAASVWLNHAFYFHASSHPVAVSLLKRGYLSFLFTAHDGHMKLRLIIHQWGLSLLLHLLAHSLCTFCLYSLSVCPVWTG